MTDLGVLPELGSFDHYARLVQRSLSVPVGLVSIVEEYRQVFPGALGLPDPWQEERESPLSHSICKYVVAQEKPFIIEDAREEPFLVDNLAIPVLGVIRLRWLADHQQPRPSSGIAVRHRQRAARLDRRRAREPVRPGRRVLRRDCAARAGAGFCRAGR